MNENIVKKLILKASKAVVKGSVFKKPKLVILMGLPGSGKSYVADYLNKKYGFTILSGENITCALFVTEKCSGSDYALAYKILRKLALRLLKQGCSVVIDGTNLKYLFREQIYKDVGKNFPTVLFYFFIDDETALKRIQQRGEDYQSLNGIKSGCSVETYMKFKDQLEEPTLEEEYFKILSDNNVLSEIDSIIQKL